MARFIKGDVVVIPFPFSDLSGSKRRPAVVINPLPGNDVILCQITSKATRDKFAIEIKTSDFDTGSLPIESYVRPNKIFTADQSIILRKAGSLNQEAINQIVDAIVDLIKK
jgi:mRNA interferase MazF